MQRSELLSVEVRAGAGATPVLYGFVCAGRFRTLCQLGHMLHPVPAVIGAVQPSRHGAVAVPHDQL